MWAMFKKKTVEEEVKALLDQVEREIFTAKMDLLSKQASLDWLEKKKSLLLLENNRASAPTLTQIQAVVK